MQEPVLAANRLGHLVTRFFGHLTASGLTPLEQQRVQAALDGAAAALFWEQDAPDQRHAFDVATRVALRLPGDAEAFVAALLHDVGKRHAHLGAVGRSMATAFDGLGLPMTSSMHRYRLHGPIGAAELEAAGMSGLVSAFAAFHPGPPPAGMDAARWRALLEADG